MSKPQYFIPITKYVVPDLVCYTAGDDNYSKQAFQKMSFCLKDGVVFVQGCDGNKEVLDGWDSREHYLACRINDNQVEIMKEKYGWVPSIEATKAYIDQNADKELLDG